MTSEAALMDLNRYITNLGFRLSTSARRVFEAAERKASAVDTIPLLEIFLWALFHEDLRFRFDSYNDNEEPYSRKEHREFAVRTRIIDLAMAFARRNLRREILSTDVVEAMLEVHNESAPAEDNDGWTDTRLNLPYNAVTHIVGGYYKALDIPFSEIINTLEIPERPRTPVEGTPAAIRSAVLALLQDHPDYDRNCFLVMPFASSRAHTTIHEVIKPTLHDLGFDLLRADDRAYADDLFLNVQTYMHGCAIAVAVFERVQSEVFNPNVSFEVGYMYGIRKQVCLLNDRTLPRLPADVAGKLYEEFDVLDPAGTIPSRIERWLRDKKLL